jgi:phytoene dehydrogenase-like protein
LAAAIRLAQEGLGVLVLEANDTIGGSARSAELTLPGFVHDVCSSIHPLGLASPFFRKLPLAKLGLHWIQPEVPLAHPLEEGRAAVLECSVAATADGLGVDKAAYQRLMSPLVSHWETLTEELLQPMMHWPKHPVQLARFGLRALRSAATLARTCFAEEPARALFSGLAAHSFLPLEQVASASFCLMLGMLGHASGWPLARGGSQQIADALAAHLRSLGGEIATHIRVESLDQLPLARATLLDLTPLQLCLIAENKLPASYLRRLGKYRYGPGVFKIDYALGGPIPWKARACGRAGTVHVCGGLDEVAASERAVAEGKPPEKPFVLVVQSSLFDPTRVPEGKHTAWVYCHVPNGSLFDMTTRIESQIERFAPGFRERVLARHVMNCSDLERRNANLVGGDISGGATDLKQLIARPIFSHAPYRTPVPGLYLCSSSTPPGGGVHGMCGFHAAETVLRDCFR